MTKPQLNKMIVKLLRKRALKRGWVACVRDNGVFNSIPDKWPDTSGRPLSAFLIDVWLLQSWCFVFFQVICTCGETSEPLPFVQLVHYVSAHSIMWVLCLTTLSNFAIIIICIVFNKRNYNTIESLFPRCLDRGLWQLESVFLSVLFRHAAVSGA